MQLPANLKVDKTRLRELIAPGDPVAVNCGYDNDMHRVFTGYVAGVAPKVPIEILCEDEAWKLKQSNITDSLRDAKLQDLVNKHFKGYETRILDTAIGNYQIDNASQAKILQSLREQFGLYGFFRQGVLVIGRVYDTQTASRHTINFNRIIEHDLQYRRKEDIRLQVIATSNNPDGSKTEVRLGDADGEQRSLNFYNLPMAALRQAAEREMERLKHDGYRGSMTCFGAPFVQHGDIIELINNEKSDTSGRYWVDAVSYSFGVGGYRQKIKLGPKA
ncbi:MAG TPA: hypothetical protein VLH56_16980 [Dissulfurispiraceae bacterium]|nr:hypothetical protein [Dissulfurispiraceae bacterium]